MSAKTPDNIIVFSRGNVRKSILHTTGALRVLLVVDPQKTFCKGGSLAVKDGDAVIPVINALMHSGYYDLIVITQDYHPADHKSFFEQHPGKKFLDVITLNGIPQVLWYKHGVGSLSGYPSSRSDAEKAKVVDESAEFHDDLDLSRIDIIVRKGMDREVDSYSGFYDNGKNAPKAVKKQYPGIGKSTGLAKVIKDFAKKHGFESVFHRNRGVTLAQVDVVGLALDYCVAWTAKDAFDEGHDVRVISDGTRAIGSAPKAVRDLRRYGCSVYQSSTVLRQAKNEKARHASKPSSTGSFCSTMSRNRRLVIGGKRV